MSTHPDVVVSVHRASPIGDQIVPRTTILVDREIPSGFSLSDMRAKYDRDAGSVAVSLHGSLPGGTFDRLLIKIMEIKVKTWSTLSVVESAGARAAVDPADAWRALTDEQRHDLIVMCCRGCGSLDSSCRCWDDS